MPSTSSSLHVPIGDGSPQRRHHHNRSSQQQQQGGLPSLNSEQMRKLLMATATKLQERISMDTLRPLPLFLGISGPSALCISSTAFSPPTRHLDKSTVEKVRSRLTLNTKYFLSNYALVTVGVSVVVALMHPSMLISIACVWALWRLHALSIAHQTPLMVGGKDLGETILTVQRRTTILTVLTTLVVVFQCLKPVLYVVFVSGVIILSHAFLRDPRDVESFGTGVFRGIDSDEEEEEGDAAVEGGRVGEEGDDSASEGVMVERSDAM